MFKVRKPLKEKIKKVCAAILVLSLFIRIWSGFTLYDLTTLILIIVIYFSIEVKEDNNSRKVKLIA